MRPPGLSLKKGCAGRLAAKVAVRRGLADAGEPQGHDLAQVG